MARTLMPIANADVLHSRSDLVFRNRNYVYQIKEKNAATELSVTDGERRLTANLLWAFGSGKLGQSYLFLHVQAMEASQLQQGIGFSPGP